MLFLRDGSVSYTMPDGEDIDGEDIDEVEHAFRLAYQEEGNLMERQPIAGLLRTYEPKIIRSQPVILLDYMCVQDEVDAAKKMAHWEKGARVKVYGGGDCYGQFNYNLITHRGTLFVHEAY